MHAVAADGACVTILARNTVDSETCLTAGCLQGGTGGNRDLRGGGWGKRGAIPK